jgi:hypothetical protein
MSPPYRLLLLELLISLMVSCWMNVSTVSVRAQTTLTRIGLATARGKTVTVGDNAVGRVRITDAGRQGLAD